MINAHVYPTITDEHAEFYIDVFNGGKTFNRARLEGYLKQVNVEEKPSYFIFLTTKHVLELLQALAVLVNG